MTKPITVPALSLVVLVGASGSGKSTFARRHFKPTEILSSDACRAMVADDENDQSATGPAFEVLHVIAAKRLAAGRLTVVDATNVQPDARKPLVALARQYHCLPVAMDMVASGAAICVPGNHETKLLRKLRGKDVQIIHGLAESLAQLAKEPPAFVARVAAFLDDLVSHYVLDGGRLVVAHAGVKAEMQGRGSREVREFCLYGETTGETDEYGLPRRYNWAADYRGPAMVVYGHTPVPEPEWLNHTLCIDTGCVFGGRLTALRYPERELVSVPAARTYYEPAKPFLPPESQAPALTAQQVHDDLLDLEDIFDAELLPWSAKAQALLREQYAPTGAAATVALDRTVQLLAQAGARGVEVGPVLTRTRARADMAGQFVEAYRPLRQDSCRVLVFESRRG